MGERGKSGDRKVENRGKYVGGSRGVGGVKVIQVLSTQTCIHSSIQQLITTPHDPPHLGRSLQWMQ